MDNLIVRVTFFIAALMAATVVIATETLVKNVAELDAAVKAAQSGDVVLLADGEWRDADLEIQGFDSRDRFVTYRAQTPGKVVLTGTSRLRIAGEGVIVDGLLWKDSSATDDVICFRRDSKLLAKKCTVQNCAILGDDPAKQRKWVSLYGNANKLINCRFEGKRSEGTLVVVWLDKDGTGHWIGYNFFGERSRLGKNGGEIIRIGDSDTSQVSSYSVTSENYFYRCDGEAEIISNKSCDNGYGRNVFVGCSGALTLRHGDRSDVHDNYFFGDRRRGTGGVRVIGEKHRVADNLFYELTGDDTRAAVSIMNGLVDSPLNGYFQVKEARLLGNRFFHCKQSIMIGLTDEDEKQQTLPPTKLEFTDNRVLTQDQPIAVVLTPPVELKSLGNSYFGGPLGLNVAEGWYKAKDVEAGLTDKDAAAVREILQAAGPTWMKAGEEFLPEVLKATK